MSSRSLGGGEAITPTATPAAAVRLTAMFGPLGLVTLTYIGLLGLGRLVGFGRESLIAYLFGASAKTDVYVAATALPEVVAGVFLAGLIGYVLIPRVAAYQRRGQTDAAREIVSAAVGQVVVWCGGLALLCALFPGGVLAITAPGLAHAVRPDAETLLRISAPAMLFFGLAGVAGAVLNARYRFLPIPLSLLFGNAVAIGILLTSHWIGILAAGFAYTAAAAVTAIVQWALAARTGLPLPRIRLRGRYVREVVAASAMATLVVSIPYVRYLVERAMVSTLGRGDLAALGFAGRTILFAGALISVPIGTIAFPSLVEAAVRHDWTELAEMLTKATRLTLLISVPATVLLVTLATSVVRVLFEHGKFGSRATDVTASILRLYAIALIPMALTELFLRAFFALQRQRLALVFLATTFGVNIAINVWLLDEIGVRAVAVGAAVGIWLNSLCMAGWVIWFLRTHASPPLK